MKTEDILRQLPFAEPYLFVDELHYVNEKGASGSFTFREDLFFYKGHFIDAPVTPGAILVEVMGQIGGTCLGLYLNSLEENSENQKQFYVASSYEASFIKPVFPNEKVTVVSELIYARFNKLKYKVAMTNEAGDVVCEGVFSGMGKSITNGN